MANEPERCPPVPAVPRTAGGVPTNKRVLYVRVPEPVFNRAKAMAYLSGVAWPDYVTKLLEGAQPIPGAAASQTPKGS